MEAIQGKEIVSAEAYIDCSVHGLSPLLQHRFGGQDVEIAVKAPHAKQVAATDYSKEYLDYLYLDEKGRNCIPSTHFEATMTKAANTFTIPGHKGKRYAERAKAFLIVEPLMIPIEPQEFHVDTRPVVIQRSRVLRMRPCFNEWAADFHIRILDSQALPPEDVNQFLQYAGRFIGIGDFRPKFGRFEVTRFENK